MKNPEPANSRRFLLTAGGPTYRLEMRIGLIQANTPRILRRAVLSIFATWVPLLVLSALQGNAVGHHVPISFLNDVAVHARFLLAVPILLLAETVLGPHLAHAADHFVNSGLVREEDYAKFDFAIDDGLRLRDSTAVEVLLIALAYIFMALALFSTAVHVSTWYALRTPTGVSVTWSGWWFVLFCVPLMQFLTLRWLWRLFLWSEFLWRMSRLNLQLIPTHPDESGGLAFVGEVERFFGIVLFGFSVATAGVMANGVLYDRVPLSHFAPAIAVYVFLAVAAVLAPLLVFARILRDTKRLGLYMYGTLATEYTSSFQKKWVTGPRETGDETLLGTGDIQSLADLGNSYSFINKMDLLPMEPRTPIYLALACLIPMAPLLLTVMPLGEIVKLLLKVVV